MFMGNFNIDNLDFTNPITKRLANILRYFGLEWSIIDSLASYNLVRNGDRQ